MTKQKKKLCFLMPTHFDAGTGGAEYQVKLVMDNIGNNKDYDIHFLCRRLPPNAIPNNNIWKIGLGNTLGKFGTYFDCPHLYSVLKKLCPDLIYQNVGCAYTGIAAYYAKTYGSTLIWHIASDVDIAPELHIRPWENIIGLPERLILDYGVRNAHIIAAQTWTQCMLLEKRYGRKCDAFIPVGHPVPEKIISKSEKIKVLWIANLKPLKRPEIFVRLAQKFMHTARVEFVMMGRLAPGLKGRENLLRQIENTPNLKYIGQVPQEEVNRRLDQGHILVNTSRYEGFSNTFVQAWMRSVPVVSLSVDPDNILVRERIGFHSNTFERLCHDLKVLIQNRELRQDMGNRARNYACENHSVEKMVQSFLCVLEMASNIVGKT
jgi:glycosyltransferase involved in cell wall biosynthesis